MPPRCVLPRRRNGTSGRDYRIPNSTKALALLTRGAARRARQRGTRLSSAASAAAGGRCVETSGARREKRRAVE